LTTQDGYFASGSDPGTPGHRHDPPDPQQADQSDALAQIIGVLGADAGQWVERVAVAVQPRQLQPAIGIDLEVGATGARRREQRIHGKVWGGDEPARVHLYRGQAEVNENIQRFFERLVMQAGGVGTKFH